MRLSVLLPRPLLFVHFLSPRLARLRVFIRIGKESIVLFRKGVYKLDERISITYRFNFAIYYHVCTILIMITICRYISKANSISRSFYCFTVMIRQILQVAVSLHINRKCCIEHYTTSYFKRKDKLLRLRYMTQ